MFYKEWIKTRWFYAVATLITLILCGYVLLNVQRLVALKGAAHLWEVVLTRDAVFIQLLRFLPLIVALCAAAVQFVPEMQQKRLKLTLHLPQHYLRSVAEMLAFGVLALVVLFACALLLLHIGLAHWFAPEIVAHIMRTALPWFVAGLAAYAFGAWVCLEPTWRMRLFDSVVAVACLRLFFLSETPEAYNAFVPWLTLFALFGLLLPILSVKRFKDGKE